MLQRLFVCDDRLHESNESTLSQNIASTLSNSDCKIAYMTRGEKITAKMKELGLNKSELARRVGVSHTTVGYWQKDEVQDITYEHLLALSHHLKISLTELNPARYQGRQGGASRHESDTEKRITEEAPEYMIAAAEKLRLLDQAEMGLLVEFMDLLLRTKHRGQ